MATLTSQALSFEKQNSLRDPSFLSYLSSAEENFILELTKSSQKASPPKMTPPVLGDLQGHHFYVGRVKDIQEGEIDVFGAEKYFQGELEKESIRKSRKSFGAILQQNESNRVKSTQSSPGYLVSANKNQSQSHSQKHNRNQKIKSSSPSVRSGSSANSQSVLLDKVARNRASTKGGYVKNFLASLACNCNDGAAVKVDKKRVEKVACSKVMAGPPLPTPANLVQEAKSMPWTEEKIHINLKREDCLSFPVLSKLQESEKEKKTPLTLERKLSMVDDWDAVIPREKEETKLQSYGSDASSDLFELESFSTNGMSSCMTPITCYAPSETSIQWSVITASAANCSAFSDYKSSSGRQSNLDQMVRIAKIGKGVENKRGTGILSGCTSLKAVRVVENEYRTIGPKVIGSGHGRNELSPITPVSRFRGESKLTVLDSARGYRGFTSCSLPHSHPLRPLYV